VIIANKVVNSANKAEMGQLKDVRPSRKDRNHLNKRGISTISWQFPRKIQPESRQSINFKKTIPPFEHKAIKMAIPTYKNQIPPR
jgi:hypothetical protein